MFAVHYCFYYCQVLAYLVAAGCRELASQLREEVVQQVKEKDIKLYLVSLGPPERGVEFAKHTGFPDDQLLADPESAVYEALSLHNSALDTFFNPQVTCNGLFYAAYLSWLLCTMS